MEVNGLVTEMDVRLNEQLYWYTRRPTKIQLVVKFTRDLKTWKLPLLLDLWKNPGYMSSYKLHGDHLPANCRITRLQLSALEFENVTK